jgi:hypothetical protein
MGISRENVEVLQIEEKSIKKASISSKLISSESPMPIRLSPIPAAFQAQSICNNASHNHELRSSCFSKPIYAEILSSYASQAFFLCPFQQ